MGVLGFGSNPQTPPSTGAKTGQRPTFGKYKFYTHAKETKIKGGKVGFFNKVSNVKWDKMMSQSGKKEFLVERGKEKVTAREMKRQVANIIEQYGGKGITGKALKVKLVRKYGMKYKDADIVARAATYQYHVPEPEGPSREDFRKNIRSLNATTELSNADEIEQRKNDPLKGKKDATYKDIGVKDTQGENAVAYIGQKKGKASVRSGESDEAVAGIESKTIRIGVAGEHGKKDESEALQEKRTEGEYRPVKMSMGGVPGSISQGHPGRGGSPRAVVSQEPEQYSGFPNKEEIKQKAEPTRAASNKTKNPVDELMAKAGLIKISDWKIIKKDKEKKVGDIFSANTDGEDLTDGEADDYNNEEELKKAA